MLRCYLSLFGNEHKNRVKHFWKKEVDCTIADSNIISISQRYYPELATGFAVTQKESLAWVVAPKWKGLLAAQSYQESHWNPRAKSPPSVRGMMMLTVKTCVGMLWRHTM